MSKKKIKVMVSSSVYHFKTEIEQICSAFGRYLRKAKEVGIVEFKGTPKTGGYFLTKKMQSVK